MSARRKNEWSIDGSDGIAGDSGKGERLAVERVHRVKCDSRLQEER